jgi:viroplasmin and RNaseH domain-containing protein
MTDRKKGILDKIGNLIPGFKGYVIREEKRNDDNKLRDKLHALLKDSETEIINFQQELIKQGNISKCQEWEIVRKSINTLYSKIKYSSEGESSFFSNNQIKDSLQLPLHLLKVYFLYS